MKLRVWHSSVPSGVIFNARVNDLDEAKRVLNALIEYDLFLGNGDIASFKTNKRRHEARYHLNNKYNINKGILLEYDRLLAEKISGGIPFVYSNTQGLEYRNFGEPHFAWKEFDSG